METVKRNKQSVSRLLTPRHFQTVLSQTEQRNTFPDRTTQCGTKWTVLLQAVLLISIQFQNNGSLYVPVLVDSKSSN